MEDKVKRTATSTALNLSSFMIICTLFAFLGGAMLGKVAHNFYVTMFSPDVVIEPNTQNTDK